MTSCSINLLFINEPQCLESSLHTLLVAMSGKPRESFQVVKNNLCLKGMHIYTYITEPVYCAAYACRKRTRLHALTPQTHATTAVSLASSAQLSSSSLRSMIRSRMTYRARCSIWGGGGAFHQAFCQCFSLTNLLSANQMQGFQ